MDLHSARANSDSYHLNRDKMETDLKAFLLSYCDRMDAVTVYTLLNAYGNADETLMFAELIGDQEKVITYWIDEQDFDMAANALTAQVRSQFLIDEQTSLSLFYKYSPALMKMNVEGTIELWMKHGQLEPRLLIPSLLEYQFPSDYRQNRAILFLEYSIHKLKNVDSAVHNFLISLYVQHIKDGNETCLLNFLNSQRGRECFDVQQALFLFHSKKLWHSTIHVFCIKEMYEQAVELALSVFSLIW